MNHSQFIATQVLQAWMIYVINKYAFYGMPPLNLQIKYVPITENLQKLILLHKVTFHSRRHLYIPHPLKHTR